MTTIDLRGGATAGTAHALAAVHIGVSVAFGPARGPLGRRAAHRFAGAPAPARPPRGGAVTLVVGGWDRTEALWATLAVWAIALVVDVLWSFSYTLWPRGATRPDRPSPPAG